MYALTYTVTAQELLVDCGRITDYPELTNYFLFADDPSVIRKRYGALAELFSYRLLAGRESDCRCVRHVDCRQKEGSEADMPRLTVKGRTCPGGLLIDPPGRSQRDACSRRCCASRNHCAIFSSFTA